MILDKIVDKKIYRLKHEKDSLPLDILKEMLKEKTIDEKFRFQEAIRNKEVSIIAEVKKASPSKGIISEDFDYLNIALEYQKNGASCLSVLTEEDFFMGSAEILTKIREKVSIPVLRKDFIIDEYQIYQSKLIGADAILLIARILTLDKMSLFFNIANSLGMDCLFEAHDLDEINLCLKAGAKIIGVNNRDLDTFTVDISLSERLVKNIPDGVLKVSESGIKTSEDITRLSLAGFDAFLIGEAFMKEKNPGNKLKEIKGFTT